MDYRLLADEILIKLLKADDEAAFKEIYNRYWKQLFNAAYYRLVSKEAAKEILQNLFLHIWEKRSSLTIGNLESYLHVAVKNRVINYIESVLVQKKYQQHIKETWSNQSIETEATVQYNELYLAFQKAIQQLPPKTRDVFKMSRMEHLSVKEIAQQLNISEKAVEYHITSSLKTLRINLKDFMVSGLLFTVFSHL
ncbi:MAG: RNA polymerase sigma-70 factor [Flavihumibacter sp.]|nr:RNA polymerase sigma-70 factor [Flavihumibacter sp.]